MLLSPLVVDIRAGAVSALGNLLSDRRISAEGHVAVAVGPGQGERVVEAIRPSLANAEVFTVRGGDLQAAGELQSELHGKNFDALVGIGGGRTLDVAKYAATRVALPMVAVATNLAHDGIASPVSTLLHAGGRGSFGVAVPIAVVVDLDYVRSSPPRMVRSGVGDVVSNLSALADWALAERQRQEPVDGLAAAFARTAAEAILHRADGIESDHFLTALAESLVLSGMAMVAAGSSRPCSGGDHEILYALDALHRNAGNHGELAGVGALFALFLRGDDATATLVDACLRRHDLPRLPADLGLTSEQFAAAVELAPTMRPDRFTILEHLDLDRAGIDGHIAAYVERFGG